MDIALVISFLGFVAAIHGFMGYATDLSLKVNPHKPPLPAVWQGWAVTVGLLAALSGALAALILRLS